MNDNLIEIDRILRESFDRYKINGDGAALEFAGELPADFEVNTRLDFVHVSYVENRARQFIRAARVPLSLKPQIFGLWSIERATVKNIPHLLMVGFGSQVLLRRITMATVHLAEDGKASGEIVMEDSQQELRKHLPIWLRARGRVLLTGLGLGCVVRGLLHNPEVTHIDVIELDPSILRICGAEFAGNPRVTLHLGDALKFHWPRKTRWDFIWHDVVGGQEFTNGEHTQVLHARLFHRYDGRAPRQGAWEFPRYLRRKIHHEPDGGWLLDG